MNLREKVLALANAVAFTNDEARWARDLALTVAELALEHAAELCDALASDKWDQYKGRKPYEPMNANRANPQTQGESDGLSIGAAAIRAEAAKIGADA